MPRHQCVDSFCGIDDLPTAMRVICVLVVTSTATILTPVTFLCHLSVLQDNFHLTTVAGLSAPAVSLVVFAALLFRPHLYIHMFLNLAWLLVTAIHIMVTMYLFFFYTVAKTLGEEGCIFGGYIFFSLWFFNMVMMVCGLLVYWSTLFHLHLFDQYGF